MTKWNYGDAYLRQNMRGEIYTQYGVLQVNDIFNPLPEFMLKADCLFMDPPCSIGNLRSFYTKAEIEERFNEYEKFTLRLFECINIINPSRLFIEVFKSNKENYFKRIKTMFPYVQIIESCYYHNRKNRCWVIHGSFDNLIFDTDLNGTDEEDIIKFVCKNVPYEIIGDLCMGRGLVAVNAAKNKKQFVGTELNEKRLAVCVERLKKLEDK